MNSYLQEGPKKEKAETKLTNKPAIVSLPPTQIGPLSGRRPHHMTVLLQVPRVEEISSKDTGILWEVTHRNMEVATLLQVAL